jgi:hypothetical protein
VESAPTPLFAMLRDALRDVDNGRQRLLPALSGYEREMIRYGFAAVRPSLAQMHRLHADSPISRLATKVFFRLADLSPALQKRMLDSAIRGATLNLAGSSYNHHGPPRRACGDRLRLGKLELCDSVSTC